MSEWKKIQLGKIAKIQTGPFGSQLHQEDYVEDGIPLVTVKNLGERRINRSNLDGVSEEDSKRLSKYSLKEGDIVFSRVGAYIDKSSIVTPEENGWIFSSSTLMARPEKSKVFPQFLIYSLNSPTFKKHIRNVAVGATRPSLNTRILSESEIKLPSLSEQKAIAHILGTLDDKIELNRHMNQTLESMAQALFKSWFVDFDPVIDNALAQGNGIPEELQARAEKRSGLSDSKKLLSTNPSLAAQFPSSFVFNETLGKWIPEGWEDNKIKEFGNVVCGKTPSKSNPEYYGVEIPFVKIPNMHNEVYVLKTDEYLSKNGSDSQSKKLLPEGSISVSCIATVGKVIITSQPCHTNQQINSIVPDDSISRHFLYFKMLDLSKHFHDLASAGSTTLNLNTSTFSNISILNPKEEVLKIFDRLVLPKFSKILLNQKESESLTQLRDRLLPELINGRVRVTNENPII